MIKTKKKLGEMLLESRIIDEFQLKSALALQKEWGGRLGAALIRKGFVREEQIMAVIEQQMGIRCVPLDKFERPSEGAMRLLNESTARKHCIVPQKFDGRTLVIAASDPTDLKMLDDLGFLLGVRISPLLAIESDILAALDHFYNPAICEGELKRKSYIQNTGPSSEGVKLDLMKDEMPKEVKSSGKEASAVHVAIDLISDEEMHKQVESAGKEPGAPYTTRDVITGIVDLLVEKGIFTRAELAKKMQSRRS